MTRHQGSQAAVYELTIVGALGPVLQDVLRPWSVTSTEHHTIVRTTVADGRDLVDLVLALDSMELQIADVAVLND
jgi:hypothetical protein